MASPDLSRVKEIFNKALSLEGAERLEYLDQACAGDAELRSEIDAYLTASEKTDAILGGAASATVEPYAPVLERPGTAVGRYKILQQIGEGGFGVVFMAEQEEPVRRKVALKIIKLGMDTAQVVARFEAERQALAMMDHAGIAKVFDGGSTETGRPFFVMELVKGIPITTYCDRNHLSIADRLALFIQVCQAMQHAHQKGLIHRDVKPSNILVSTQDEQPVAKVIDFGIAKATQARLTERTLFTEFEQLIGTPEYMSPEQAEGSLDVDTRSDVYSLGVLLYELLTGTPPFDPKELRSKAFAEMQRVIREVDPPAPSTRLSSLQTLPSVAANRQTEPRKLCDTVHGELDWIVMKAMEKDRRRRYESASALAGDLMHYLADEPVSAAAPSRVYRARKFVRRHKVPVIACAAVLVALVAGMVGTTIGLIGQAHQRRIAEQQTKIAEEQRAEAQKQSEEAGRQAAVAQAVGQFQSDMLASADPEKILGDKVTVVQAVMAAVQELDAGKLKGQPLTEAAVRQTIGDTLRELGRFDDAAPNLRKALELRRTALPSEDPAIGWSLQSLAMLAHYEGRLSDAEQLYRRALDIYRKSLPPGDRDTRAALGLLAELLRLEGKLPEAEPLARECVTASRAALSAGDPELADAINMLALTVEARGGLGEAEALYREAMEIDRKALPAENPRIGRIGNNLGMLLQEQGRLAEAEPLQREALASARASLPAEHPHIAVALNNLGLLLQSQGKLADAEPMFREALAIERKALPPDHPNFAACINNLARLLHREGKLTEAEPLFREAVVIVRNVPPPGNPEMAACFNEYAGLLLDLDKPAAAEPIYREAIGMLARTVDKSDWRIALSRTGLGRALSLQGRYSEAEAELIEADRALATTLGAPPNAHPRCVRTLVALYTAWDHADPNKGYDAKAQQWSAKLPASPPATTQSALN